jgi:hypothetical protein
MRDIIFIRVVNLDNIADFNRLSKAGLHTDKRFAHTCAADHSWEGPDGDMYSRMVFTSNLAKAVKVV